MPRVLADPPARRSCHGPLGRRQRSHTNPLAKVRPASSRRLRREHDLLAVSQDYCRALVFPLWE